MFIIDLDELNFGELLEVFCERAGNRVERPVRLTLTGEINMRNTIGEGKSAVARETVQHEGQSLIAFDIAWTLEEFIEHCTE